MTVSEREQACITSFQTRSMPLLLRDYKTNSLQCWNIELVQLAYWIGFGTFTIFPCSSRYEFRKKAWSMISGWQGCIFFFLSFCFLFLIRYKWTQSSWSEKMFQLSFFFFFFFVSLLLGRKEISSGKVNQDR